MLFADFELNFLSTAMSHPIITIIPKITPNITLYIDESSNASGIKSKQTTAIISPDANDKTKLKNLFEFLFEKIPN